jgi:hypothetical protein
MWDDKASSDEHDESKRPQHQQRIRHPSTELGYLYTRSGSISTVPMISSGARTSIRHQFPVEDEGESMIVVVEKSTSSGPEMHVTPQQLLPSDKSVLTSSPADAPSLTVPNNTNFRMFFARNRDPAYNEPAREWGAYNKVEKLFANALETGLLPSRVEVAALECEVFVGKKPFESVRVMQDDQKDFNDLEAIVLHASRRSRNILPVDLLVTPL